MWKLYKYLLLFVFVVSVNSYAQSNNTIEATASKRVVTTGEIFTYTVKIEGEFHAPKLHLPKFNDFTIVSQNQQRQYVSKGKSTILTIKIVYGLLAANPGSFTIEGASIADKDKRIETQPIAIEVTGKPFKENKAAPYIERGIDI